MSQEVEILLKEHEALRAEILDRSRKQENSLLWSFALLVAMFGNERFRESYIWTIPTAFSFFGYLWLENYSMINVIGNYIRCKIENRLTNIEPPLQKALNWENHLVKINTRKKTQYNAFTFLHIVYFNGIPILSFFLQSHFDFPTKIKQFQSTIMVVNGLICLGFLIFSIAQFKKRFEDYEELKDQDQKI